MNFFSRDSSNHVTYFNTVISFNTAILQEIDVWFLPRKDTRENVKTVLFASPNLMDQLPPSSYNLSRTSGTSPLPGWTHSSKMVLTYISVLLCPAEPHLCDLELMWRRKNVIFSKSNRRSRLVWGKEWLLPRLCTCSAKWWTPGVTFQGWRKGLPMSRISWSASCPVTGSACN